MTAARQASDSRGNIFVANSHGKGAYNLSPIISEVVDLTPEFRVQTAIDHDVLADANLWKQSDYQHLDEVLPKQRFLKRLEHEKRRTDRSKAPLSITLFRYDRSKTIQPGIVDALLARLRRIKRETDILGYFDEDFVALALPDTNDVGTQFFLTKVVSCADKLHFSTTAGTYPDPIFENLLAEVRTSTDSFQLLHGGALERHGFGYPLKRTLDIVGALALLLLLWPFVPMPTG